MYFIGTFAQYRSRETLRWIILLQSQSLQGHCLMSDPSSRNLDYSDLTYPSLQPVDSCDRQSFPYRPYSIEPVFIASCEVWRAQDAKWTCDLSDGPLGVTSLGGTFFSGDKFFDTGFRN